MIRAGLRGHPSYSSGQASGDTHPTRPAMISGHDIGWVSPGHSPRPFPPAALWQLAVSSGAHFHRRTPAGWRFTRRRGRRKGVLSIQRPSACARRWFSPLRLGVHGNSRRFVQPLRVDVEAICVRCAPPTRARTRRICERDPAVPWTSSAFACVLRDQFDGVPAF